MNYKQLRYQIDCSVQSSNPARALSEIQQNIYKTQISDCNHPKTIWITSADTGTKYPIQACCGECYHCRETKQNEWVTRMWHETKLNSKYCYFITLTYKPVFNFANIPERLFDAYWHFDDYNELGHPCWSPCLCRLEHLQYFIRNLRNDLAASGRNRECTFYACAEYGKRFGRPHFHIILWTKSPVTNDDVKKAWSIRKGKKIMSCNAIGRIEVDDLNNNGTICKHDIKIDGNAYSPHHAFAYVAKYVGKSEKFNDTRLGFFVSDMQKRFDLGFFSDRVLKYYIPDYYNYISKHYQDYDIRQQIKYKVMRLLDKPFDPSKARFSSSLYRDFLRPFRPFRTCSRAQGIGSVYVKTNIDTLASGALRISDPDLQSLVFPSFYLRKIKEFKCSFEFRTKSSVSLSFVKGCRPLILRDMDSILENDPFDSMRESVRKRYLVPCEKSDFEGEKLKKLLSSIFAIRNAYTGERCLLYTRQHDLSEYLYVGFWKYDRSLNNYVKTNEMPFAEFYEKFSIQCVESEKENVEQQRKAYEALADRLYCERKVDEFCRDLFPDLDYFKLVENAQNCQDNERIEMSKKNYLNFNRKDL